MMEEITLWYRWNNNKWEYITYTKGWNDQKEYIPLIPFNRPMRFAKEFAYLLKDQIIYNVE